MIYFLAEKFEAFATFKSFRSCVKKDKDLFLKCLRTDHGGEFTSQELNDYCKEIGIKKPLTAGYTPQYNGVGTELGEKDSDNYKYD